MVELLPGAPVTVQQHVVGGQSANKALCIVHHLAPLQFIVLQIGQLDRVGGRDGGEGMIPPLKGCVVGKQTVAISFMECSQCFRLLRPVLAQGRQRFAVLPSGQGAQHFPQILILYCMQNIFRGQVGNSLQLGKVAFYTIQDRRVQTVCRIAGGGFAEYIVVGEDQLGNIPGAACLEVPGVLKKALCASSTASPSSMLRSRCSKLCITGSVLN